MELSNDDLQSLLETHKQYSTLEEKFSDRIDEIITLVCKRFHIKKTYWYFPDAPEGKVGTLPVYEISHPNQEICFETGFRWPLNYGIPSKWLYMPNAAILAEINAEIAAEKEREEKLHKAAEDKKTKKEQLKKSAAAKLTPAERKALGI